jgi:PAS domain S-box-containing protein
MVVGNRPLWLFRKAPTVMLLIEPVSGRFLDVNEAACAFYGYSREQMLTMSVGQINTLPPDLCRQERLRAVEGRTNRFLFHHRLASGAVRNVEVHAIPLEENGRTYLLSSVLDVTRLRQAEDRNAQIMKAVEQCPVSIVLTDTTGAITYVNPMFEQVTGYTAAEALGQNPRILQSGAHPPEFYRDLWSTITAGGIWSGRIQNRRKDGTPFWEKATIAPVRDQDGVIASFVGVKLDITASMQADAERQRLHAHMLRTQRLESLGRLAGGVAHDMNNVLAAVMIYASAAMEEEQPGSRWHKAFQVIHSATQRGADLIKPLLSLARQSPVEEKSLDLNAVLREEVFILERTFPSTIQLQADLQPNLPAIKGDRSALANALMNLCVNAMDAMPKGGRLGLRTRSLEDAWVEVTVSDTGSGMSADVLERAREPFFTTKEVGKGTGLGLALVENTVKTHRGHLDIASEPDRGTRVSLRFPACQKDTRAAPAPLPEEAAAAMLEILHVDDDELIRASVPAMLEALGHRVFSVPSGEAALDLLRDGLRIDLVLLDLNMPGLGGEGTLSALRALRPALPVFLCTGLVTEKALQVGRAHAGVTLLAKPFDIQTLRGLLGPIARATHRRESAGQD